MGKVIAVPHYDNVGYGLFGNARRNKAREFIVENHPDRADPIYEIAHNFVTARSKAQSLLEFPGQLPVSLSDAYRCQDAAIKLWEDRIAGWKVGMIHGDNFLKFGTDRLVGPVFQSQIIVESSTTPIQAPVFDGGFGAVEAEFVFKLGADAPHHKVEWGDDDALSLVASLHSGIEIASSPLATINDIGPLAIISDFGNNNGLIVGAPIANWRQQLESAAMLECETELDSKVVGRGSAQSIRGGLLASLKFALAMGASRAMPLRAGFFICTGAVTGVHRVHVNQKARVNFKDIETIECAIVKQHAI